MGRRSIADKVSAQDAGELWRLRRKKASEEKSSEPAASEEKSSEPAASEPAASLKK
jgi:hypothetical protein